MDGSIILLENYVLKAYIESAAATAQIIPYMEDVSMNKGICTLKVNSRCALVALDIRSL